MRRIVVRKPGGYDRLEIVEEQTPAPAAGQILVATEAIGVNYADSIVRLGLYSSGKKYVGWPITPGFEFAGRVAAIGAGVTAWQLGDAVFGLTLFGGYSSHIVVPEDQVFALPAGWTMARGAAFPTAHLTAWYALCEIARPRAGNKVLIHSAAGGVGTAAIGICRHLRMDAVGVVGSMHKVDAALRAGACAVIDKSSEDLWESARRLAPDGYDVVLDSSGVETLKGSYRALRPTGRLVTFGLSTMLPRAGKRVSWLKLFVSFLKMPRFNPISMIDRNKTVGAFNLSYLIEEKPLLAQAMTELLGWARSGVLSEPPIATYSMSDVQKAQYDLETGKTVGKLVLLP